MAVTSNRAGKKPVTSKKTSRPSSKKLDVTRTPLQNDDNNNNDDNDDNEDNDNDGDENDNDNDGSPVKNNNYISGGDSNTYNDMLRDKNRYKYRIEIQQMMFVSGEINDPLERTTDLIEDIVRDQVVALMLQAQKTSHLRGQKSILPEDLIFLIRHDKAKVNRLRTYLSWKDVRKNAKDQENGDIAAGGGDNLIEEAVGGSGDNKLMVTKQKKILKLPWELEFMFTEQPLIGGLNGSNIDDEKVNEEERDAVLAQIKRLKQNDERTKNMTQQEYVHWSECRQASFTFRKSKRFREWCSMSQITDSRPNDDVIDILGFLTFEMVCTITEEALKVKAWMDKLNDNKDNNRRYLFMEPSDDNKPIGVEHVREAWRRVQSVPRKKMALHNFRGGRMRSNVRII